MKSSDKKKELDAHLIIPFINELVIPFAPIKVKLEDLLPDGKLLTFEQVTHFIRTIEEIKESRIKDPSKRKEGFAQRFKKNELNSPYSIIVFEEEYYAIYHGVKHDMLLGEGGYGYVKIVQNIKTGEWAVLKLAVKDTHHREYLVLKKVELALGYLEREVSLNSGFITYQKKQQAQKGRTFFTYSLNQANLLMKLAPGILLYDLMHDNYNLSAHKWIEIILKVLEEYQRIKGKNIVHGDLKLENIFYDFSKNKATIIDFGASKRKHLLVGAKGKLIYSPGYTAPELDPIQKKETYQFSEATDIYALGAVFYYLLHLADYSQSQIKDKALYDKLQFFCFSCMANEKAKKRPTTEAAIEFFEAIQNSLSNILPKPFRKIGLFSVEEYLSYTQEIKNVRKEDKEQAIDFNPLLQEEKQHTEKQNIDTSTNFYLPNFIYGAYKFFNSFFYPDKPDTTSINVSNEGHQNTEEKIISEQLDNNEKGYDDSFVSTLKLFDEVWFIDPTKRSNKEYIQLRRELEEKEIIVGARCFLPEDNNVKPIIPAILDKFARENSGKNNKYFYVTAQSDLQDLESLLSGFVCILPLQPNQKEGQHEKTIELYVTHEIEEEYAAIKQSLEKLANSYDKEKIIEAQCFTLIKQLIEDFDTHFLNKNLSADYIKENLKQLKNRLAKIESSEFSRVSPALHKMSIFSNKSITHKQSSHLIEEINSQVEKWVVSYMS